MATPQNGPLTQRANWRYAELPRVLCRDTTAQTYVVETSEQLRAICSMHPTPAS
jgi:hypothetical protein